MALTFRDVQPSDYLFLFELLKTKTPEQNISHERMPTYQEHVAFNDNKPYQKDYIVMEGDTKVGRMYLTHQNEVGLHILPEFQGKGYGSRALKMLQRIVKTHLLANIAPNNLKSQEFFQKAGFELVQFTYRFRHP